MCPTPERRERKPLSDQPHAGNQPADIRLINRRNEIDAIGPLGSLREDVY